MKLHGFIGLAIILASEILLFSGNRFVGGWFTPIVWTGYILFMDAIVYRFKGTSLLVNQRVQLLIIIFISIAAWWLFEFYNQPRFWRSELELWWHYHNVEPNLHLRRVGYDWAFATIFPSLLLTAQLFAATVFTGRKKLQAWRFSRSVVYAILVVGAAAVLIPLIFVSVWFAPLIWLSFTFLLDPLNYLRGWPSIIGDLSEGRWTRLLSLLCSGCVCGVLWEFWNYWASGRWTYTGSYFGNLKLFEMPVLGCLGFPPFAVECWVMYIFFCSLVMPKGANVDSHDAMIWMER